MDNSKFIDKIIDIYTSFYFKKELDDDSRFYFIGKYVCNHVMNIIYYRLTRDNEIEVLERISKQKKEKYWELANIYCIGKSEARKIEAAKSAYILELITSTF